jgi:predicted flap endonuclease-1-like 5' DNA nuclease
VEQTSAEEAAPEATATDETPAVADDLTVIEGIGPKINSLLQEAGIRTYQELAEAQPDRISEILLASGLRLANPGTWPEQARLAAAGDWDGLKDLQNRLKGGRQEE